ncbi:MAG: rhodanese-like domain-containing protein [Lachnospiraceae bacterium]
MCHKIKYMKSILVLILFVGFIVATGCEQKQKAAEDKKPITEQPIKQVEEVFPNDDGKFHGEYIIEAQEAKDKIEKEHVLFVDARGWQQALLGTVKGAIATTWQELCTCQEGKAGDASWGKIPETADLANRLGERGMTKSKEIILLGDTLNGWGDDARLLWELRAAGYSNVKIVNGGMQALKDAGADMQLLAASPSPALVTIDSIDVTHTITTEQLQASYSSYKIIDVRTDEEFQGAVLYEEEKGGHLPGAIHMRYTDLFLENGTLKSNKEIIAICEANGLQKEDQIVTYCTGGIRSSYTQVVLEMCGYRNTYNYDQSYWRWCKVGEVE